MKALAIIALAVALESGFIYTLTAPAPAKTVVAKAAPAQAPARS